MPINTAHIHHSVFFFSLYIVAISIHPHTQNSHTPITHTFTRPYISIMKTSFIIATLVLAASVSAQTASDTDLANKWCQVYTTACTAASSTACGPNFVSKDNNCQSIFANGKCTGYVAGCICVTAAGVVLNGNDAVLEKTFEGKKPCS